MTFQPCKLIGGPLDGEIRRVEVSLLQRRRCIPFPAFTGWWIPDPYGIIHKYPYRMAEWGILHYEP